MSDASVEEKLARARHAVRTKLNHIVGYGDLFRQDAEEAGRESLAEIFGRIREAALSLRAPLDRRFASPDRRFAPPEIQSAGSLESIDREIYDLLFALIGLIQEAKRRAERYDDLDLARDVDKILEAANGLLELVEIERSGVVEPDSARPLPTSPPREGTKLESESLPPAPRAGRILVVDDNLVNREILARHLERQGHSVRAAADGASALDLLESEAFDIVILDVMMPGLNGYQILERIRADERLGDLYIIVISSLADTQSIARCIQLGAEDYLPREFEPVILKARIESCLEKKNLKEEQALYVSALVEAQERLRAELRGGAAYVRSLLPARISVPGLRTDWMFIPSASLGGDVFGYHRIREPGCDEVPAEPSPPEPSPPEPDQAEGAAVQGPLALYLIDVSGHGIESALFSVTLMNLLKTQVLPGADFGDPASVLARLSASFRMEEQNYLYFTAWYGVWDPASGELTFASAGSPPAVLVLPGGGTIELETGGVIVGLDSKATYRTDSMTIPRGSRLYLFSDGIYEFRDRAERIFGLESFVALLSSRVATTVPGVSGLDGILHDVQARSAKTRFQDDVSIMEFDFG
ncbi:MAG TPA: SpoIIE family protein phosphatase [Rectinemataceae bacterium]|nr:SpoIIE family protein phosphatase [Rectinemataceae bacterium]